MKLSFLIALIMTTICHIVMVTNQSFADHMFDTIDSQSSFNPVGSGARAIGMSGAFIAVADDATSASWNPAGLIQLVESEISIVGQFSHWTENNIFNYQKYNNFQRTINDI